MNRADRRALKYNQMDGGAGAPRRPTKRGRKVAPKSHKASLPSSATSPHFSKETFK